jgi:drug/metabolite transporter, DME family
VSRQIPDSHHPAPSVHPLRGYCYIATATFLWGVSATLGRAVFTGRLPWMGRPLHAIDPLGLAQGRATFSLLVLLPILVGMGGWQRIQMPRRDLMRCLWLGLLGVAPSNYFYYLAIQRTNVATAIIVQYTAPVWVLLYVVARRQQKLTLQRVAAVVVALIGICFVIGILGVRQTPGATLMLDRYGLLAALLAAFSFAFYNVGGHGILARYDRWRVLFWALVSVFLFWLVLNPPWKVIAAHFDLAQWSFLFVFSVVSVLGPFSLYFRGLQHLEPSRAVLVSCLEPVFSILLAGACLGETLRPVQTLGIVFVLSAIVIVQLPGRSGAIGQQAVVVDPIE